MRSELCKRRSYPTENIRRPPSLSLNSFSKTCFVKGAFRQFYFEGQNLGLPFSKFHVEFRFLILEAPYNLLGKPDK